VLKVVANKTCKASMIIEEDPDLVRRVWAARLGFLADSYDLFAIDLVVLIFEFVYGEQIFTVAAKSLSVTAMIAGVIVGQLSFGFIADWIGRKWAFVTTAALTVVGALLSASSTDGTVLFLDLPAQLAVTRFLLGLGVGGEYPLAATVAAESTDEPYRRRMNLASVISMQGFGMLLSSLVAMAALMCGFSLEVTWRVILAFGAFPSFIAFFLRWKLHESAAYENAVAEQAGSMHMGAEGVVDQTRDLLSIMTKLWRPLIGTAAPWMLMNVFQYSISSFKSSLMNDLFPSQGLSAVDQVRNAAKFSAITSCFAIVGFAGSYSLLKWEMITLSKLQISGFSMLTVVFVIQGFLLLQLGGGKGFLILLGLMYFFQNCGPNMSTFIAPAEVYPTLVRATCHGFSAASGKVGAMIGTATITPAAEEFGLPPVFFTCAVVTAVGATLTYFFFPRGPVSMPSSLKDAESTGSGKYSTFW